MINSSLHRRVSVRIRFCISMLLLILIGVGCNPKADNDPSTQLPQGTVLEDYFPLSANRYWQYDWHNNRGDSWRGSITVTSFRKNLGLKVFIVIDSTETYETYDVFRSAYLWDKDGLKHLYRANINGDSTAFMPPRLVLPSKIVIGKTYLREYGFQVYNAIGEKRYSVNVRQTQKLIRQGSVEAGGKIWDDCIAIETVWTNINTDGSEHTRRKVNWHSKGIGPVMLISDIPVNATELKGDATGELISFKLN